MTQQIVKTGDSKPATLNVTVWASVESRGGRCRKYSYVWVNLYCTHDRKQRLCSDSV